jgi:hypothetical protein
MLEFIAEDVWPQLNQIIAQSVRRRAAVSYAGRAAPTMLPLGDGDIVIVDGTDAALKAGTTDPRSIEQWLRRGARVLSLPGLHAKTLLLEGVGGRTAVVGSANISAHSRDSLIEAAIVSDTAELCDQVSDQLDKWTAAARELNASWVVRAKKIFRQEPGPLSRRERRRSALVSRDQPLWISLWTDDPIKPSAATEEIHAELASQYGAQTTIETWTLWPGDEKKVLPDQSVVLLNNRQGEPAWPHPNTRAWPPALVVRVSLGAQDDPPVAFLAYDTKTMQKTTRMSAVRRAVEQAGGILSLHHPVPPGPAADAVHDLFSAP